MSILDNEGHDPQGLGNTPSRSELSRLRADNERLRAEGKRFADWIDQLYSDLPKDRAPGPPITLLREMRSAFEQKGQQ
jgi:hypothetical protein